MINRNRLTIAIIVIQVCVTMVLATPAIGAGQTQAQQGLVYMERPKLKLKASYEFDEQKRKSPDSETELQSHDLQESAGIGTNGWVYHPNLMEYHLFFEPQWRQEKFDLWQKSTDTTEKTDRDTSILAYDAKTTFLKRKPLSLDLFANKNSRQIDLSNAQDYDLDSDTWGSRLNFNNPTLPVSLGYVKRKFVQTGFYRSDEDRDEWQLKARHNAKRSVTQLDVLYNDTDRTTQASSATTDTSSKTVNTELLNTYFFTQDNRVRLDSLFYNTRAEYSDVNYDTWLLSENLFWTHSKNLLTQYGFNYNRHEVGDVDTDEKAVKARLTHRLFNSLTTDAGIGVAVSDFDTGRQDSYKGDLGFIYRRPFSNGNIELGAAYNYGLTKRHGQESIIPTEESHLLSATTETYLTKENVDIDTIVVSDKTGAIVYVRDVDYKVEQIGRDVRITRTLLGAIPDGQQVAIRYSYRVDAGYDDSRFGQDYRAALDLWSLFYLTYNLGQLKQRVESGELFHAPADNIYHTIRLRMDRKWSETQFLYDIQDRNDGNSSVTKSAKQVFNIRPYRNLYFNFTGEMGHRDFTDTDQSERFYTLGADAGWTVKWWCHLSLVCLQNQVSGDRQDMRYSEIMPMARFTYGVWTGIVSYQLTDQADDENGDSLWRQRAYFSITRSLW